jgi:hypothetical protein
MIILVLFKQLEIRFLEWNLRRLELKGMKIVRGEMLELLLYIASTDIYTI